MLAGVNDSLSVAHRTSCRTSAGGRHMKLGYARELGFEGGQGLKHEVGMFGLVDAR
jgi:hypothetical protein